MSGKTTSEPIPLAVIAEQLVNAIALINQAMVLLQEHLDSPKKTESSQ